MATVVSAILNDSPRPPRALRPDTPADLEKVIRRCLEKDPEKRYASTGGLSEALRASISSWTLTVNLDIQDWRETNTTLALAGIELGILELLFIRAGIFDDLAVLQYC